MAFQLLAKSISNPNPSNVYSTIALATNYSSTPLNSAFQLLAKSISNPSNLYSTISRATNYSSTPLNLTFQLLAKSISNPNPSNLYSRATISTAQYVASRARDPTFEKLMDHYKNLVKVIAIQDLILANPNRIPPSVSVDFLNRLAQKLRLNRGATSFLIRYPHIFEIFYDRSKSMPFCKLTEKALEIVQIEANAIKDDLPIVTDRLVRVLSMSVSKSVPLRAIFKVWRELGLPDDFEESVIGRNPNLFVLCDGNEPNTHVLKLVPSYPSDYFTAAVENWRVIECCKEDCKVDRTMIRYGFKLGFPPGMRLRKSFKAKVREFQKMPYIGPYDDMMGQKKKNSKVGMMMKSMEKRAVGIVHEFLSLTVEKMVEVEKISHFRKAFGIEFNIRDLFLDHPGMFYLSTKGKRHTVFLREAYERGRLVDPNPVYEARMKLLELVRFGRRGVLGKSRRSVNEEGDDLQESKSPTSSIFEDFANDSEKVL